MHTAVPPFSFAARALLLFALVALTSPALAATLHVPADYSTIQAAMDVAVAGDSVLVAPGVYSDREYRQHPYYSYFVTACVFMKDGVALASTDGPEVTAIDFGADANTIQAVILAAQLPIGVSISGFTITAADVGNVPVGMSNGYANVNVENCRFANLRTSGAISHLHGSLTIRDASFLSCEGGSGALFGQYITLDAENCRFEGCEGVEAGAVQLRDAGVCRVVGCRFLDNTTLGEGRGTLRIAAVSPGSLIEGNTFLGNGGGSGALRAWRCAVRQNLFAEGWADQPNNVVCILYYGSFEANTVVNNEVGDGAWAVIETNTEVTRNIIAGTAGGSGFHGLSGGCNVFWNNGVANYGANDAGHPTDLTVDPRFCDPASGDYRLRADSPCLPQNHPSVCPDAIGAFGEGCPGEDGPLVALAIDPEHWFGMAPSVYADSAAALAPEVYAWTEGSTHSIAIDSTYVIWPGARRAFQAWSDGGARAHVVTVPSGYSELVASYSLDYLITGTIEGAGTVIGTGWAPSESTRAITAVPASGYFFSHWSGVGFGSYTGADNPATVTMHEPLYETAHFIPFEYPLTMTVDTNGGGTTSPPSGTYDTYSDVPIEATPDWGYEFYWWLGTGAGSYSGPDNPAHVTMNGPITQMAVFRNGHFPLTMEAGRGGSVSPETFEPLSFSAVEIEAHADPGFVFREWIGEGDGSYSGFDNPASVTMSGPITQRAEFDTVYVPQEYLGFEFTLSLSDTDPHVHTGDPIGLGRVFLWFDCASDGGLTALELDLTGSLAAAGFNPAPGLLGTLSGSRLSVSSSNCLVGPRLLGEILVLPPGEGWMCISRQEEMEPAVAHDCGAPLRKGEWPRTVRFTGVDTAGGMPCATGTGCAEPPPTITDAASPAPQIAYDTALLGGFPNPFTGATQVRLTRATPGRTRLTIYDVTGRLVRTLLDEPRPAGAHAIDWDARTDGGETVPAGIYFVRLESDGVRTAQKIVRLAR